MKQMVISMKERKKQKMRIAQMMNKLITKKKKKKPSDVSTGKEASNSAMDKFTEIKLYTNENID